MKNGDAYAYLCGSVLQKYHVVDPVDKKLADRIVDPGISYILLGSFSHLGCVGSDYYIFNVLCNNIP